MRAVVQRVSGSSVAVSGVPVGRIGPGLVVFLGVGIGDNEQDAEYLANKISALRVFEDRAGMMNLSVADSGGEVMVISQFTLFGDCRKGRRPGFSDAASPGRAEELYNLFCRKVQEKGLTVATGKFQSAMQIRVDNDGPVTILLDSKKTF